MQRVIEIGRYHPKELCINTDYDRCFRPLFVMDKQRLCLKKKHIHVLEEKVSRNSGCRSYCCL